MKEADRVNCKTEAYPMNAVGPGSIWTPLNPSTTAPEEAADLGSSAPHQIGDTGKFYTAATLHRLSTSLNEPLLNEPSKEK